MPRLLATAFTLAVLVGLAPAAPVPDDAKRSLELPRAWELKEIEEATPPHGAGGKVHVLAWLIMEDERPLRVETCLVLKELAEESEQGRWGLAHLYRHPLGKDNTWRLPPLWVSPPPPLGPKKVVAIDYFLRLKKKPGNEDIYAAMKDVQWRFDLDEGWNLVSCAVCESNWKTALGEKPTRFFGKK